MEILTYINFLGTSEAAKTGDNINLVLILLIGFVLLVAGTLCYVLRSKRISSTLKKIIGIGLPSIFLVLAVPMIVVGQSWAAGSSTSVNAVVDTDNGLAYIENGNIQNTTEDDMQLIVSNSQATNAGLNMPGLQNANLKVFIGGNLVLDDNPFDGYDGNIDLEYELKPGQSVQFSSELTGLDKQTAEALEGSGNSIQMRFKFYYSMVDKEYGPTRPFESVADYLYEAEYDKWDVDKTNFLCECMAKREWWYAADSPEYKEYLRKEWGCNEDQVAFIVELRKYLEGSNPYLCTSCRYGEFIGRNFDWAYDDLNEYIIRTKQSSEHIQSIGVASSFFPQLMQDLVGIESVLPMLTMDGINKNGVAININVVPSNFDDTIGTNPGKERLCAGVIPRFVLDNATSASHAIELLKNRDIYTIFLSEFHFMISDANETYIVETVHNKLVVLKQKHDSEQKTAMANFHVTNSDHYNEYELYYGEDGTYGPDYSKGSMGVERYALAIDGLQNVTCLDSSEASAYSMVKHMERIYYKHVNLDWRTPDGNYKHFWSDKNGQPSVLDDDHIFSYYDSDAWDNDRIKTFEHNQENYNQVHAREDQIGQRVTSNELANGVCQTVHASCYDIKTKELVVNVQERDVSFHFSLDGGWRENGKATGIFVNGDNVGLATECNAPDSKWTYNPNTHILELLENETNTLYSVTGTDLDVTIHFNDLDGYSITIPKMDHAQTWVQVGESSPVTAKARRGVRAVPKNSYVKVTFKADEGYEFLESGQDTYEVEIKKVEQSIIFGTTPDFDLPTVVWAPIR